MIGDTSTIQNAIRQNIGLKTDSLNGINILDGSLHAKISFLNEFTGLYSLLEQQPSLSDITYSTNTSIDGNIVYGRTITVNSGVVLTASEKGITLVCETLTLGNNAVITATGKGTAAGLGGTYATCTGGTDALESYAGQGGGGGAGGTATTNNNGGGAVKYAAKVKNVDGQKSPILTLNKSLIPLLASIFFIGTGGGGGGGENTGVGKDGGPGGGYVIIVCKNIISGTGVQILANGVNGVDGEGGFTSAGGGGGGGGLALLLYHLLTGTLPTLSAAKGLRGNNSNADDSGILPGYNGGDGIALINRW